MRFDIHCRRPFPLPHDIDLDVARWKRSSRPTLQVSKYEEDAKGNLFVPTIAEPVVTVPRGNYSAVTIPEAGDE